MILPLSRKREEPKLSSELDINLGVDFGTSYTKVCYRDVGADVSGVLTFKGEPLVPSIVRVSERGIMSTSVTNGCDVSQEILFLKMRIAMSYNPRDVMESPHVDLNDAITVQALSSYFLADIIRHAKREFTRQESELSAGRTITWSANIGVPVEHYDSPTVCIFRRVFAIAWKWETSDSIPRTVKEAIAQYRVGQSEVESIPTDCHAVPEIVAAVLSFLTSREAQPGVYTYFDVGGGTVDGVCFKYEEYNGRIRCYSGKVAPLGISELAHRLAYTKVVRIGGRVVRLGAGALASTEAERIERSLSADTFPPQKICRRLQSYENRLQTLVGTVIMAAKMNSRFTDNQDSLPFFLGGGGAHSAWYRTVISNTIFARQHANVGIRTYDMRELPVPQDLKMKTSDVNFPRFTVAYGLSVPIGEAPPVDLPSAFPPVTPPRRQGDTDPYSDASRSKYED